MKIPIEVSARHIHLCQKDLDFLFGKNYQLEKLKDLSQPGEFAAKEVLKIKNGNKVLKARIVGPLRKESQVEISLTDSFYLKTEPVFKLSGGVTDTPGIILKNNKKELKLKKGLIIPLRHIHCSFDEAKKYGLKDNVSILVEGKRKLVFENIHVRKKANYKLCLHLDTDEGNACGIFQKSKGKLL